MLKKLFLVFAAVVAILLVLYWVYFPSISRYRELKLEEEKLTKRIEEIDTQIKTLSDERNLLQTDVSYLEKVIREELGFVKPGEIVYELITKKSSPNSAPAPTAPGLLKPEGVSKAAESLKNEVSERKTAVAEKTQNVVSSSKTKIIHKSI